MAGYFSALFGGSAGGGGVTQALPRVANDFYPTHERVTQALLSREMIAGTICEPCAGEGHIVRVLESKGLFVSPNDITWPHGFDMTQPENWLLRDWTITNPPFNKATPILQNAYEHSRIGVAFLLRLSYLEPCVDRARWLQLHPPTRVIILNPRPKFRSDTNGSDSVTTAWFVWRKSDNSQMTKIDFCNNWKE